MTKAKKILSALLASMAVSATAFAAPLTPEAQIDFVLDLPVTHGDELEMRLREDGDFAVTDLDGNGRIELLFLRETRNGVPQGAEKENETAWRHIASVPVERTLCAYEVGEDGTQLVPVAIVFTDDEIAPNLEYINGAYRDTGRGITYYDVSTLLRVGDAGWRIASQSVSLQNGTLQVQTLASEYGNYGIYEEQATPEAVFDHATDRDGHEMSQSAFSSVASDYAAGCEERFQVSVRWHPTGALREAKMRPDGMKGLMLDSWQGFSLKKIK